MVRRVATARLIHPVGDDALEVCWGRNDFGGYMACLVAVRENASADDRWHVLEDGAGDSRLTAVEHLLVQLERTFGELLLAKQKKADTGFV